jgi:hypothetical protein
MDTFCMMTDEELVVSYAEGNDYAFDLLLNGINNLFTLICSILSVTRD